MGMRACAFNLQFGNERHSYQDLIPFTIGNTPIKTVRYGNQIMPSSRGSHSEISGT
jgi:hypothetical protein